MAANKTPPRTTSPILCELFQIMQDEGISCASMAQTLEVRENTVSLWRRGKNEPGFIWIEKMAQALGYKLTLEKMK